MEIGNRYPTRPRGTHSKVGLHLLVFLAEWEEECWRVQDISIAK